MIITHIVPVTFQSGSSYVKLASDMALEFSKRRPSAEKRQPLEKRVREDDNRAQFRSQREFLP
jgi:hypothetical protein